MKKAQLLAVVDATHIAEDEMHRHIVNTTMLGAFARATGLFDIEDFRKPITERFGDRSAEVNVQAIKRAWETVIVEEESGE